MSPPTARAPITSAAMNRPGACRDAPAVNGPIARTIADEPAHDDRLRAVAGEEPLDVFQAGGRGTEPGAVAGEERPAQPAPEQEAASVAGDGRRPDDAEQEGKLHLPPAREDTAQDDGQLAGRDQADERARLQEREPADERVRPRPEAVPQAVEQRLGRAHARSTAATPSLSVSSDREEPSSGVMSAPECSASSISASAGSRRGHPFALPDRAPDQR